MEACDDFIYNNLIFKRINMYRAIVFVVFVVTVSADDDMRKCGKLMRPNMMHCCTAPPPKNGPMDLPDDIKECMDSSPKPPSCDMEICVAKKRGYYASDGTIDVKALTPVLEKEFKESPDIFMAIKEKCLSGDVSKYGPPDMCEFSKMRHCIHMNVVMQCPEWSDKGECSEVKGLLEECAKSIE